MVCTGFRFELLGDFPIAVQPDASDLAAGKIAYALGDGVWKTQPIHKEWTARIDRYAPLVLHIDDRCVMIGVKRLGRNRAIPGEIVRAR